MGNFRKRLKWASSLGNQQGNPLQARITVSAGGGKQVCSALLKVQRSRRSCKLCMRMGKASVICSGVCPGLEYLGGLRGWASYLCAQEVDLVHIPEDVSVEPKNYLFFYWGGNSLGLCSMYSSESCSESGKNGCRISWQIYRLRPPVQSLNLT